VDEAHRSARGAGADIGLGDRVVAARITGRTPAETTWATVSSIAFWEATASAGRTGASPKSTTRSSSSASTPVSR